MNIHAIGFNPYVNMSSNAHGNDEFLNADIYLFGIEIYKRIIVNLGGVY